MLGLHQTILFLCIQPDLIRKRTMYIFMSFHIPDSKSNLCATSIYNIDMNVHNVHLLLYISLITWHEAFAIKEQARHHTVPVCFTRHHPLESHP